MTLADVDGVPIMTVLDEKREIARAARLARLHVSNARAPGAQAPPVPPELED